MLPLLDPGCETGGDLTSKSSREPTLLTLSEASPLLALLPRRLLSGTLRRLPRQPAKEPYPVPSEEPAGAERVTWKPTSPSSSGPLGLGLGVRSRLRLPASRALPLGDRLGGWRNPPDADRVGK